MQKTPLLQDTTLFLDDKPSVYGLRQKARQILLEKGFPSPKTEAWKYTNIKPLLDSNFKISTDEHICGNDCCNHKKQKTPFIEVTFCHGKLHIEEYNTPDGLHITPLPLILFEGEYKQYINKSFPLENYPFALLNTVFIEQGICIHIEKDIKINTPIIIKYNQNHCDGQQINIHNIIIAEKNTNIEIVEKFSSNDNSQSFINIVNEFYLNNNANINHYKIQNTTSQCYHIALNAIKIQKDAIYKQYYYTNSSKISRNETLVNLEKSGACAEVYSAYIAKNNNLIDITTNINHIHPKTTSNQSARAILEDNSEAAFQGKIYIAPNAAKTSGHQIHKALYLNDNAILNCKPELEIYADDVKCSHGASCGEIDKEQLFYLTSRGINKEDAINLLTQAHLEEIFALIPNTQIKDLFFN